MKITETYRPRTLSEVAAQKTAISQIENSIARSGLAGSSWWISGATGTGKTTIARILAEEFTQTDFTVYEFVGRDISVDDIREYERRMAFCPMGKGRCLIINEAQDMSDSVVTLLLSLVEKVNASKYDMIVFTAMVDVLELKHDPMNRWRALTGRCSRVDLAETDSPVFRQEVVEYLEGIAASEGIFGADVQSICERAGWSIRAALNALDMQERRMPEESGKQSDAVCEDVVPMSRFQWFSFHGNECESVLVAQGEGKNDRSAITLAGNAVKKADGETGFIISVSGNTEGAVVETKIFRFVREKGRCSWTKVKKSDILLYSDVLAEVNCA